MGLKTNKPKSKTSSKTRKKKMKTMKKRNSRSYLTKMMRSKMKTKWFRRVNKKT